MALTAVDKQAIKEAKIEATSKTLETSVVIPLSQNFLAGVSTFLIIFVLFWGYAFFSNIPFLEVHGQITTNDLVNYFVLLIGFSFSMTFTKMLAMLVSKVNTGFTDIVVGIILSFVIIGVIGKITFQPFGIVGLVIGIGLGILVFAILCLLIFIGEESQITSLIYKLGRQSQAPVIIGLKNQIRRLELDLELVEDEPETTIRSSVNNETYQKRRSLFDAAMQIYQVSQQGETPTRNLMLSQYQMTRSNWEYARDALLSCGAINTEYRILNNDMQQVKQDVADWFVEAIK